MRKITANYIYSSETGFLKYGIIVLDDANNVSDLIDTKGVIKEVQGLEFYSGLIVLGRIENIDLIKYLKEEVMIEKILSVLLKNKKKKGLSILSDVDLKDFKIKPTTRVKVLV